MQNFGIQILKFSLFVHSLRGGGAERIVSYMANYWAALGHEVNIITMAEASAEDYITSDKVTRITLQLEMKSKGAVSGIINNIVRLYCLRKELKRQKPDVLISMMPSANVTAAFASIGLVNCVIGSERIYPAHGQLGRFWSLLRKHSYRLLDLLVVQTNAGADWVEKNTNAKNVIVIPNQLELPIPRFKPIVEAKKEPGRKVILGIGRLVPQKQFEHLVRAFSSQHIAHEAYDLVILGEGGERQRLESLVNDLGLEKRVSLPGRAGNVEDWLKISDMFVLSSAVEGFPNALLEAMSHGLPCVAYDCLTGPSDIITDYVDGLLVEAGNIEKLGEKMSMLITDASLRSRLITNSANTIKKYETQVVMDKWESAILYILDKNSQR